MKVAASITPALLLVLDLAIGAGCSGDSGRSRQTPAGEAAAPVDAPPTTADATPTPDVAAPDALCRLPELPETPICCGLPGERPGNNCFSREQVEMNLASCHPEGTGIDARFSQLGIRCCQGLVAIEAVVPVDGGGTVGYPAGCGETGAPPSYKICARCGDGVCGKGENRCNCPQDCTEA